MLSRLVNISKFSKPLFLANCKTCSTTSDVCLECNDKHYPLGTGCASCASKNCESCDSKLCSSCVKKKNVELNNKTSIQIPLCPYCEKLMNQITEHMNFLKVKDDAKEHQIVSFHNNIIEKCISFSEELMTVDILIALAMATQPPEMIELERCDEQLIIVREKQRKILELEEFIDIFPKQQYGK